MTTRTHDDIEADVREATNLSNAEALLRHAAELDEIGTPQADASAWLTRGWALYLRSDYPGALEYNLRALARFEELGDRSGMAHVIGNIGIVHFSTGNYPTALEHLHRALAIRDELNERGGVANVSANIGNVCSSIGDYPSALEYYNRSLALHVERGDRGRAADVTCNLGILHGITGDYPAALEHFHRVLALYEETGDRSGAATAMSNIGNVYSSIGDLPSALDHFQRALSLREVLGDRSGVASATGNIGNVLKDSGEYPAALQHYHNALALSEEVGDRNGAAYIKSNIIGTYFAMGSDAEAQAALLDMDSMHIDQPMVRIARELLRGMLQERGGDVDGAMATLQRALTEAKEYGLRSQMAETHKALRDLALKRNDLAAYVEHNNEYTRITEEINGKDTATKLAMQTKQREIDAKDRETQKQLAVLHSTLPKEIAERVARGEVVNDHYDNASVIFLDIVGFTELSSSMSSQEVITLLDDVFTQCDAICAKHGVTKIKTIGDSYMCVSFDSVVNAALCAMDMSRIRISHAVSHAVSHNVSHNVAFRIGMHCGPVTAGVIGKERMQYDVWGDTVNVASRMESSGEAGRIHISEAFAIELKKNQESTIKNPILHEVSHNVSHSVPLVTRHLSLVTIERGSIDIKGKGPMQTYWLESTQP